MQARRTRKWQRIDDEKEMESDEEHEEEPHDFQFDMEHMEAFFNTEHEEGIGKKYHFFPKYASFLPELGIPHITS